jgi:zinc transporter ZupT
MRDFYSTHASELGLSACCRTWGHEPMNAILMSCLAFVSTLVGGLCGFRYRDRLHLVISFTSGVLIAVCFFEILPEIFSLAIEHHLEITPSLVALVLGFLSIHTLEKVAVIHAAHEQEYAEHQHAMVGLVGASGLAFHSVLDGVGIGLGFQVNPQVGLLITVAVMAHDFSDGLNTVSLMLLHGNTPRKATWLLMIDALAPIVGASATYVFTIPDHILALYLGFFGGFILYIGASDLLPEAHSTHSSFKMIGLTILGILFIFIVTRLT